MKCINWILKLKQRKIKIHEPLQLRINFELRLFLFFTVILFSSFASKSEAFEKGNDKDSIAFYDSLNKVIIH